MTKKKKILNGPFEEFRFARFGLFRISIFGFRILPIKDRPDDSAKSVGESGSGDSMKKA